MSCSSSHHAGGWIRSFTTFDDDVVLISLFLLSMVSFFIFFHAGVLSFLIVLSAAVFVTPSVTSIAAVTLIVAFAVQLVILVVLLGIIVLFIFSFFVESILVFNVLVRLAATTSQSLCQLLRPMDGAIGTSCIASIDYAVLRSTVILVVKAFVHHQIHGGSADSATTTADNSCGIVVVTSA